MSAATSTVLRDKGEEVRRYTRGMLKAARYYAENKQAWVTGMQKLRDDIKEADLEYLWDQFPTAWAVNGQLNLDTLQKTADYLYRTDDFKDVPRIETREWVDTQFVDGALGSLGVYAGSDDPGRAVSPR